MRPYYIGRPGPRSPLDKAAATARRLRRRLASAILPDDVDRHDVRVALDYARELEILLHRVQAEQSSN